MSFPKKTAEYSHLKEFSGSWGLAYGPLASRRLGTSLGINLLGSAKICSFDCPYCELGSSELRMNQVKDEELFPKAEIIGEAVRVLIRSCLDKNQPIDSLTISGNGEPTLHPFFYECTEAILQARSDLLPEVRVVAMTNAAHCDNRRVVQGLNLVDERLVKLDAGNDSTFKRVNKPLIRGNVSKISAGARKLKDMIVQSMFVQGTVDNTANEDIEEWLEVVGILRPKAVQIYTIDRVPATAGLKKVDEDTLYTIASRLKRKLQIEALVFP